MKIYKYTLFGCSFVFLIVALFIIFNKAYFNFGFSIDTKLAAEFGNFFGGFIGAIFSVISVFLLIFTIIVQNIENSKRSTKEYFLK